MSIFKKKAPPTFAFESVDLHQAVSPHVLKRVNLQSQAAPLRAEQAALLERYHKAKTSSVEFADLDPAVARARELAFGAPQKAPINTETELIEIGKRLKELDIAISLVSSQIETERRKASAEICETRKPEFVALEKELADKLIAASKAAARYQDFVDCMEDARISTTSLTPIVPHFLGAKDPHDRLASWLRDACKRGTISTNDIPTKLSY